LKLGDAIAVSAYRAVQRRICISMATFRFAKRKQPDSGECSIDFKLGSALPARRVRAPRGLVLAPRRNDLFRFKELPLHASIISRL
jgi:hypothetical protein